MKNLVAILILSAVASASGQTYGLGNTDPSVFSKFRIPETNLSSFWFNSSISSSYDKFTDSSSGYSYDVFNTMLNAALSPKYEVLRESDDRYLSVNLGIDGNYQNTYTKTTSSYSSPLTQADVNRSDELDVNGSLDYRDYFSGSERFVSLGSEVDVVLLDRNYTSTQPPLYTPFVQYQGEKNQDYSVSFGFGWGKMRDVTAVVSAIRFQERLKQLSLLNNDLDEKTIEDLAQEFYREGYYSNVHVRPDKFFWQDVEKTLSADGVSLTGINQYGDSYLREVPGELRFIRHEGAIGGFFFNVEYSNAYNSLDYYKIDEELFGTANAYVQWSHQMNLNSQLAFSLSIGAGPNLIKHPSVKNEYSAAAGLAYDYEITDRIVATLSNSFNLKIFDSSPQAKLLTNNLAVAVNYFVEDQISVNGNYSWNYNFEKNYSSYFRYATSDNEVSLGLSYYFERGMIIP